MEAPQITPAVRDALRADGVSDRMITDEIMKQFAAEGSIYALRSGPRDTGRHNRHCVTLKTDPRTGKPVLVTRELTFHYTKGYRLVRTSGAR